MIEIWEPRYRDNTVLVASRKVRQGEDIEIAITRGYYKGQYTVKAKDIAESPREMMTTRTGGQIEVIAVKLSMLKKKESTNDCTN